KFLKKDINVYTVLGDGECQEGQVWESFMYAAHYKLDNLCVIIDFNNLQIDGRTTEVMNIQPLDEKLKAFGFEVCVINGNDFDELDLAFSKFHETKGKPFAIIMNTVKGKGVSFMEDVCGWHGKAPNEENYKTAMAELNAKLKELEA
ncbi:MAG: transketolase, partial [Eubacterium sp.]|nr:transketolase [Eubacterium sp.]